MFSLILSTNQTGQVQGHLLLNCLNFCKDFNSKHDHSAVPKENQTWKEEMYQTVDVSYVLLYSLAVLVFSRENGVAPSYGELGNKLVKEPDQHQIRLTCS